MYLIDELYDLVKRWRIDGQYEPQWDIAADELEEVLDAYVAETE